MEKLFFLFIVVGFFAQMIDGALGMGYGTISAIALLSMGIPPATTSAGVHAAKIIAGGVSGIAHLRFGNVDRKLFERLLVPGILGGIAGAFTITHLSRKVVTPVVSVYLAAIGLMMFYKAVRTVTEKVVTTHIRPLALVGGFLDSAGGGWGPIVTSTLMARGNNPRLTIGTVNLVEFFVSLAQLATLLIFLGKNDLDGVLQVLPIIAGLIVGAMMAAPIAAYVCRKIPAQAMIIIVSVLIIALSAQTLLRR
ncbi:MAG: sulfite exporter TauE/SafE family protein [Blastocatellia bacterium]|nr:sulfite exporter TauE/SafE family protein [Blastocatellia bacterium]